MYIGPRVELLQCGFMYDVRNVNVKMIDVHEKPRPFVPHMRNSIGIFKSMLKNPSLCSASLFRFRGRLAKSDSFTKTKVNEQVQLNNTKHAVIFIKP